VAIRNRERPPEPQRAVSSADSLNAYGYSGPGLWMEWADTVNPVYQIKIKENELAAEPLARPGSPKGSVRTLTFV